MLPFVTIDEGFEMEKVFFIVALFLFGGCTQQHREFIAYDADVVIDADSYVFDADVAPQDADGADDADAEAELDADQEVCNGQVWCEAAWVRVDVRPYYAGSYASHPNHNFDERRRLVLSTIDFEIQNTEVTRVQFYELMGYDPTVEEECLDCPVGNISWHEAAAYTNALSRYRDIEQCYACYNASGGMRCELSDESWGGMVQQCDGYRLPTEVEWEFAARGGVYADGNIFLVDGTPPEIPDGYLVGDVAWHNENSNGSAHSVASKAPNVLGLYDILGNRWEPTHNWYEYVYPEVEPFDYAGPEGGDEKTYRGGSAIFLPSACRFSDRSARNPTVRQTALGVRVVRTLSE